MTEVNSEMPKSFYSLAWLTLASCFGEQENHEALKLMDAVERVINHKYTELKESINANRNENPQESCRRC